MKNLKNAIRKDLWMVLLDIVAVNAAYYLTIFIRFFINGRLRNIADERYLPAFFRFALNGIDPCTDILDIGAGIAFESEGRLRIEEDRGLRVELQKHEFQRAHADDLRSFLQIGGRCLTFGKPFQRRGTGQ